MEYGLASGNQENKTSISSLKIHEAVIDILESYFKLNSFTRRQSTLTHFHLHPPCNRNRLSAIAQQKIGKRKKGRKIVNQSHKIDYKRN